MNINKVIKQKSIDYIAVDAFFIICFV